MTNNNPTRILFYCQSLAGIGHLTASLQVISKLLQHSDVDLIYGGHKIDITLDHRGFRHISLHTILIDETTDSLYDPNRQFSVDQLWPLRAEQIRTFLSRPYDAAISYRGVLPVRQAKVQERNSCALQTVAGPSSCNPDLHIRARSSGARSDRSRTTHSAIDQRAYSYGVYSRRPECHSL